jgi:hypothetical protein
MDSNVLATSSVIEIINTAFFRKNCIVIGEIAFELSDTSIARELEKHAVAPTAKTLKELPSITDDLVRLDILKTDHGNGEALLLAEAVALKNGQGDQLLMDFMKVRPVIVTDEKAVDKYAKSIGIEAINRREFMAIFNKLAEDTSD